MRDLKVVICDNMLEYKDFRVIDIKHGSKGCDQQVGLNPISILNAGHLCNCDSCNNLVIRICTRTSMIIKRDR